MRFLLRKYLFLAIVVLYSVAGLALHPQQDIGTFLKKAQYFSVQSNFDSSLYYFNMALQLAIDSNDKAQIAYINKLKGTDYIYMGQYDTALVYLTKSRSIAEKLKNDTIIANANLNIGFVMYIIGNSDSAGLLYYKSLDQFKIQADTSGIAKSYNLLSILYKYSGDYEKGIEAALKSCYYFKKLNQTSSYFQSLNNLGNMYEKLGEYDTAYSCYQICQILSLQHNSPKQALTALINMAVIDYNQGIEAEINNNWEIAKRKFLKSNESYLKAIEISKEKNDKQTLALCYSNMSNLSWKFEQYQKAIKYSAEALVLSVELGDMNRQIHALRNLGISYLKTEDYQSSIAHHLECLELANNAGQKENAEEVSAYLSMTYEIIGDYKEALKFARVNAAFRDSLFNVQKQELIEKHKTDFEILHLKDLNQLKELDKKRIKAERNTSLGLGIIVVIILLGMLIIFRMRAKKNKIITTQRIQKLEDEKKLMAARSVLVGQEKERERIAQELHDGIGVLLSTASIHFTSVEARADAKTGEMLKKANKLLKEAGQEVRQISHNMMPGVLSKFGLKEAVEDLFEDVEFTGNISADLQLTCGDSRLAENMEIMIFRVVQEMLNNTLKHAKASKVSLYISRDNNEIFLDYADNGIGFDEEKLPHESRLGLSGIQSRIEYLGGIIKLTSAPDKGTRYSVSIPLSEKIV